MSKLGKMGNKAKGADGINHHLWHPAGDEVNHQIKPTHYKYKTDSYT